MSVLYNLKLKLPIQVRVSFYVKQFMAWQSAHQVDNFCLNTRHNSTFVMNIPYERV